MYLIFTLPHIILYVFRVTGSFIKDIEAILDLNKVQIHEFKITKDSFNSTIKTQLV